MRHRPAADTYPRQYVAGNFVRVVMFLFRVGVEVVLEEVKQTEKPEDARKGRVARICVAVPVPVPLGYHLFETLVCGPEAPCAL